MSVDNEAMETIPHHGEEVHTHNHTKWYVANILALFVLTAITVLAAGVNFGSNTVNLMIAMAIATVKASLVALIFMHLLWERGMNAIIFLSSLFFVALFMSFTFFDLETRAKIEPSTPSEPGVSAGYQPAPLPIYVVPPKGSPEPTGGDPAKAAEGSPAH
ncbi:MAG: cytochrome C oxidase subunit IV family protein [Bryobacterales bacterium]|nr:cytochrome C oxidase subunit IV family protein [Bryobacterales bacterium]